MQKQFFIFIGRSGSGKGTQAELLKKSLEEKGVEKVLHVTTGDGFRTFIEQDTYISRLSREVNTTGALQPEFLAVYNWANIFVHTLQGGETILLDGAPRKPFEVHVLHSAITFMGYEKPIVVYVDVSEGWARERLVGRGREDDKNGEEIERRLSWFETEVLPTFQVYLDDPRYTVLHINGEQTVEEVHAEILSKVSSSPKTND